MVASRLVYFLIAAVGGWRSRGCVNAFTPRNSKAHTTRHPTTISLKASRRGFLLETAVLVGGPSLAYASDNDADNAFIRDLVAKSEANREAYNKQAMRADKLSFSQFRDQYKKPRYVGVKTSSGTMQMVTPEQLQQLKDSNRIRLEYGIGYDRDGSQFVDYSKQVLVLVEDQAKEVVPSEE